MSSFFASTMAMIGTILFREPAEMTKSGLPESPSTSFTSRDIVVILPP
jgi:hypothetical protein